MKKYYIEKQYFIKITNKYNFHPRVKWTYNLIRVYKMSSVKKSFSWSLFSKKQWIIKFEQNYPLKTIYV